MRFEQFNKPHAPTDEAQKFVYQIYRFLFKAPNISIRTKQVTLETAAVNLYPWKIVCISRRALQSVLLTGSAKGLRRAHPLKRAERAKRLFNGNQALEKQEFIRYYFHADTVALVVAEENNRHGTNHWSDLFEVPEGRITGGSFSVRLGSSDLSWIKELCNAEGIMAAH